MLRRRIPAHETRGPERIKAHYDIEVELADRLRNATAAERLSLYRSVYDELFQRVPDHSQITKKATAEANERRVRNELAKMSRLLKPSTVFAEVGPGDCAVAIAVARHVAKVYAIDVSAEITRQEETPDNFELLLTDGVSIPLPPDSVDVFFSHHLMEHLHPEDALVQLSNIYRALIPGGRYVCTTPNRFTGPHDVSRYFDREPRGLHLKEYSVGDLVGIFRTAGFRRFSTRIGAGGHYFPAPLAPVRLVESLMENLGPEGRRFLGATLLVRLMFNRPVIATK